MTALMYFAGVTSKAGLKVLAPIGATWIPLKCVNSSSPRISICISLPVLMLRSTVDRSIKTGSEIHIEIRGDEELTHFKGIQVAPIGAKTFNPAFDVTPAKYISAVITEKQSYEIAEGQTL